MASRSYTPPTCTLEVTAKGFALLAWMGLPKRQRFHLSFDDPRIPEAEHITIKGDRAQLDTLHQVVTSYVQEFLTNSPNAPLDLESTGIENDGNAISQYSNTKIQENTAPIKDAQVSMPSEFPITNQEIYLQPHGLLNHDLFLGGLANKESESFITLSMLQLFDLAIALDECQTDLQTLPQFQSDPEVKTIPEWLRSAVLVMITVGITASAIKLYDRYAISQKQQNTTATSEPTINNNQPLQPISPQVSPSASPLPIPTTTPSSPLPSPPTNLPTPTTSPLPIVKPSPIQTPSPLFPQANSAPPAPTDFSRPPQNQGGAATVVIPAAPSLTAPPIPPPPIPNYGGVPAQSRSPLQPAPNLQIQPPPFPQNPPPTISRGGVRPFVDVSRIPVNVPANIELPPLQDVQPITEQEKDVTAALDPNQPGKPSQSKYPLFDKIPQVVEVREYFQSSWKPPQDLDKNLQYSLLLNGDGSVAKVIPIGQASVEFYGNTNMPLEEEAFVSNIEGGKSAKIRIVLRPDGQVMTFLESLN